MSWGYSTAPQNLTEDQVRRLARQEAINSIQSQSITGSMVPKSVPWNAVDLPLVTAFPLAPQDRDEVNLLNETSGEVTRWVYLNKTAAWTQIGGVAVGVLSWTGAATAPAGYVVADGSAISRTTYAGLFAAYGTTHGVGDGSTTFNVPNVVNRTVMAAGGLYALGATGGAATHTLTTAEMPAHTHGPSSAAFALTNFVAQVAAGADFAAVNAQSSATNSAGSGGAHNNLPPYIALTPIIRT